MWIATEGDNAPNAFVEPLRNTRFRKNLVKDSYWTCIQLRVDVPNLRLKCYAHPMHARFFVRS